MKKKNVFLCLLMALSLVCNLSVMSASATSQKDKITLNNLPAYSGEAYVELNDNVPSFSKNDMTTKAFEKYSELDDLVGAVQPMPTYVQKRFQPKNLLRSVW